MRDLPHHMKKLNRRVIRSVHREEEMELQMPEIPGPAKRPREQLRRQEKIRMRNQTQARIPSDPNPVERNKIMAGGRKGRVPVFDKTNKAKPKRGNPSRKKTPGI